MMNIRIKTWKDIVFLLLAFISSTAIDKILELLKGNSRSCEFKTKPRMDRLLLCSFIGLIFFCYFYYFSVCFKNFLSL